MRNIEIKVGVADKASIVKQLKSLGAQFEYTMKQCDYYFEIGDDKEKLRVIDDKEFQLITYRRIEKHGRKDSFYDIKILDADEKDLLLKSRKVVKLVEKVRDLWLYDNTRIHIDHVKQLGDFLELETVVKDIPLSAGKREFEMIINGLGINSANSVPASYSDMVPAVS